MAQASSAQREPSMEEILASIRRIIEDSDLGRKPEDGLDGVRADNDVKPTFAAARAEPVAEEPVPMVDRAVPAKIVDVDVFRAELRSESAIADGPRSITLAEVQAQIDAERDAAAFATDAEPSPGVAQDLPEPTVSAFEVASEKAEHQPAAAEVNDWRLGVPEPEIERVLPEAVATASTITRDAVAGADEAIADIEDFELDLSDFQNMAASESVDQSAPVASDEYFQTPRPSLISDHVGKQVATSFGELSEALAARNRKNLDEMAEDMLRPMLQDWIDNNLPLMVERLVREEIERVARG